MSKISPLYNMLNCNLSQWYYTLDTTVPKCLSEGSQFVLVTKSGACNGYRYHVQIYQGKQSNVIYQPLETCVINNMVFIIFSKSNAV